MNTGDRIRERRKELKISADKLGKMIGKDRATIYRYENNDIENIPYTLIKELSNVLHVQPAYLMCWDDDSKNNTYEYIYFPTAISAGLPMEVDGVTETSKLSIANEMLGKYSNDRTLFFARANGDSMDNYFDDDALIGIKPLPIEQLKNGDIVVYSDNHDYSVKQYYKYGDTLVFKPNSTNPVHKEHTYDIKDNIVIHGKVVVSVNTYD